MLSQKIFTANASKNKYRRINIDRLFLSKAICHKKNLSLFYQLFRWVEDSPLSGSTWLKISKFKNKFNVVSSLHSEYSLETTFNIFSNRLIMTTYIYIQLQSECLLKFFVSYKRKREEQMFWQRVAIADFFCTFIWP